MATFFAFVATACDVKVYVVNASDDPRFTTQPGEMLVPLSVQICKAIEKICVFALLCKADYDAVSGYVAFERVEEVI